MTTNWEQHLAEALRVAVDMRAAQQRYFKAARGSDEKTAALRESVGLERKFDAIMARLTRYVEWSNPE
jgi:hypothetical protein